MMIRGLLLLMILGLGSRSADARWMRLRSPNFELYTDSSDSRARQVLTELEQFRNVFVTQSPERNVSPLPVRVFLFQSEASFRPFQIRESSAGYYRSGPDGDYIAMRASDRTASHEYVHAILHHAAHEVPAWFGEGMAEFYSTVVFRGNQMVVGEPVPSHLVTLRAGKLLAMKTLLAVDSDSPYYRDKSKFGMFYAESWALVHMLHLSEKYRSGIAAFVTMTLRGEPDALQKAFGRTETEIEKDLRQYVLGESFSHATLPAAPIDKLAKVPGEPLSELDAALLLAKLFTVSERRSEAGKLYEAILKAHPNSAEAEAALGYLALQKAEDESAVAHLRRALDLGLRNARLCLDLALLRRDQKANDAEVLDLLRRSVRFDPDLYESRYSLGQFALRKGLPSEALPHLNRAAELQPNRMQAWDDLATAYLENKDRTHAAQAAAKAVELATTE